MDKLIEVIALHKSFSDGPVIEDVSFVLKRGEVLGIVGPNGCGKTTMLRIFVGIENADKGEVKIYGKIGYVPQENLLLPWLKLKDNIVLGLKMMKLRDVEINDRLRWVTSLLGLEDHLNKYPNKVSGGTARKAAIARALVIEPDILLLDEPYTGLDSRSIESFQKAIIDLKNRHEMGMVIVSHQIDELVEVSDNILVLTHRPAKVREIISLNSKTALKK